VSGLVRIKLIKGNATVVGRSSQHSLYNLELATYKANDQFDHHAAEGFIKLWGLQTKVYSMVNGHHSQDSTVNNPNAQSLQNLSEPMMSKVKG
jgi:argininosuccinate synthase